MLCLTSLDTGFAVMYILLHLLVAYCCIRCSNADAVTVLQTTQTCSLPDPVLHDPKRDLSTVKQLPSIFSSCAIRSSRAEMPSDQVCLVCRQQGIGFSS